MPNPLILIHGYSDKGESFKTWKARLVAKGLYKPQEVHICSYRSLTNEVTIKDIAEGFDRALKINMNIPPDQPFDAIVHSTGMLVLRSWLTAYGRHERLKRIVAIAPASFGSPLAHKGRSWIGAIFKGNREAGPDFMEAGDLVLDGLELGSSFTWDLAHKDLLGKKVYYGPGDDTPYIFTFCGNKAYKGLRGAVTKSPGTDGTVRWAGCSLNTRKIKLDFTTPPGQGVEISTWLSDERSNLAMPFIPMRDLNHASIIEDPTDELVDLVAKALRVTDIASYQAWIREATAVSKPTYDEMEKWQQFVIKAVDERGDPITDFHLQLYKRDHPVADDVPVKMDVHAYSGDNSLRCFHVNLDDVAYEGAQSLRMEFMASSGTQLLGYYEYRDPRDMTEPEDGQPAFTMDLTPLLKDEAIRFFYPFTTTFIEIVLNREPLPLRAVNKITQFIVED